MPASSDRAAFWTAPGLPGCEWFKARFQRHRFTRHVHPTYAIGTICDGTQTFWCRGQQHVARPGTLHLINPDDVHDGAAVEGAAYRYRMLYVHGDVFASVFGRRTGFPLFERSTVEDSELAERLRTLSRATEASTHEALDSQGQLFDFLADLGRRHGRQPSPRPTSVGRRRIARAQRWLDEHLEARPSLADAAEVVGLSPYHFHREFRRHVGLPPHAWLNTRRVQRAGQWLRAGRPAIEVAAGVGFCDQSHLIREFKRVHGVTPRAYVAGLGQG